MARSFQHSRPEVFDINARRTRHTQEKGVQYWEVENSFRSLEIFHKMDYARK